MGKIFTKCQQIDNKVAKAGKRSYKLIELVKSA